MVLPPSIDPTPYIRPPRLTVRSGLSLSKMLLRLVPKGPNPGLLAAAKALRQSVAELDGQWKENKRLRRVSDVRPFDHRLDRAWSILESSLERYTLLRPSHAKRKRAVEIHAQLFSEGLSFLKLRYIEQHAESARRIDLIRDEGLRDELESLVGKEFVDALHAAHKAYGDALGITKAGEPAHSVESLLEPLRAVSRAMGGYMLQVLAFAALHPDNVAPAKRALEPIDQFRAAPRRAGSGGTAAGPDEGEDEDDVALPEDAPDPESELPELPAA